MHGALMVCGTASDVGKSHVVAGLCRALHRRGVRVAPFKAQNMSLNSYVTATGHEIGRAQAVQAFAAGIEPEVAMNPVLLKPTSQTGCQVVVLGRPVAHLSTADYHERKPDLRSTVLDSLAGLRARFDVVLLERTDAAVVGTCGGYQVLGRTISDPDGVEAPAGTHVAGLGWLDVDTTFSSDKTVRQRRGAAGGARHGI